MKAFPVAFPKVRFGNCASQQADFAIKLLICYVFGN